MYICQNIFIMKKLLLSLLVMSFSLTAFAQEHMTFKGVPIDGNVSDFVNKLVEKGLTVSKYDGLVGDPSVRVMNGTFAGIQNCDIIILSVPSTKIVCKVSVTTPNSKSWDDVLYEYNTLKKSLLEKYSNGEVNKYEYFVDPYSLGDGYELQALYKEKCKYYTSIMIPQGAIAIYMTTATYGEAHTAIHYEDKINWKAYEADKKKTISEDI